MFGVPHLCGPGICKLALSCLAHSADAAAKAGKAGLRTSKEEFAASRAAAEDSEGSRAGSGPYRIPITDHRSPLTITLTAAAGADEATR
jgi:hypothetical protein